MTKFLTIILAAMSIACASAPAQKPAPQEEDRPVTRKECELTPQQKARVKKEVEEFRAYCLSIVEGQLDNNCVSATAEFERRAKDLFITGGCRDPEQGGIAWR
jgi:hypothetical protein